jgi:hypothetical protein
VNGAAYDDWLLTPLDHLARRACYLSRRASMTMEYSPHVVNTVRALVERGHCQPLLPVTGNAIPFYSGPKEGLAWLFASEYAGIDLEILNSRGWTILGDSAFNFGRWTQLCIDDPAISWQRLYVLQAGANPHAMSCKGKLTPLDTYFRGCTAHQVEHAGRWLQVVSQSGIDLHKYAIQEQNLHQPEHFLEASWDEELWRWLPTRQRVAYHFGDTPDQIYIWLEDYDALSWFRYGRFDLDIFLVCSPSESQARWQRINDVDKMVVLPEQSASQPILSNDLARVSVLSARWFQLLILSLVLHYSFHIFLVW